MSSNNEQLDGGRGRLGARERLMEVADRLFYAEGIRSVGVDRIVAESGTAKATLYAYFPSKDALVAAYLQRRSERWLSYLLAELPRRAGGAQGRLLAIFDVLGESFEDPNYRGCPFINAGAEFSEEGHPAKGVTSNHRAAIHDLFADLAAKMSVPDPEATAEVLSMLYDGAMVMAQLDGNTQAAVRARSAAERLIEDARQEGHANGERL